MATFRQVIQAQMIMVGIPSIDDLSKRTGIARMTMFRRFDNPRLTTAAEMDALSKVLGIDIGTIAEACNAKKGKKIA